MAWFVVGLLWVAYFLNYTDRQIVFSVYPALRRELHFTDAQLGLIASTFLWVYAAGMAVSGRLADLFPRDRIVIGSLVLWSMCTVGTATSGSVGVFLFWRGMMGVTECLYLPAAAGLIASFHSGTTRSRAFSLHSTAQLTGIVAGGWYGGWAADHIGWRNGFMAVAGFGCVYAALLFAVFRRVPVRPVQKAIRQSRPLDVLRSRCYRAHTAAYFFYCIVQWMLYAWLPNFIYEKYGLSMTESGFTATIYLQISSMVGVLTGGALADWLVKRVGFGRFVISSTGLICCAPLAYLTLAVGSLSELKLCAAGFGFFAGLFIANNMASIFDVTAENNYGFATGTLNVIGGMSGAGATFLVGWGKQSIGIVTMMGWAALATCGVGIALVSVAALKFRKDREQFC